MKYLIAFFLLACILLANAASMKKQKQARKNGLRRFNDFQQYLARQRRCFMKMLKVGAIKKKSETFEF